MENTNRLATYKDLLDAANDYLGANVTGDALRDIRRAIQNGYRDFASLTNWSYFYTSGRVVVVSVYSDGTVEYDHTGGLYERMMTLTSGTWPEWTMFGVIRIDNIDYQVAERKSDTVITLSVNSNPGEDVASGQTYSLYRDTYPMPLDFQAADEFIMGHRLGMLDYVHPSEWLVNQNIRMGPAVPVYYTFRSDPNYYGVMAVSFSPPPLTTNNFDFIYKRRPRPLIIEEYKDGTCSVTNGTATVTGSGTRWKDNYIGSIIRFSEVPGKFPTGSAGDNPFEIQRTITSVLSTTSLQLDRVVSQTFTNAKYTISDPVDIEDGAMMSALEREIEKQLRILRRMKPAPEEEKRYAEAILKAREADNRSFARRGVYGDGRLWSWWKGQRRSDIGGG